MTNKGKAVLIIGGLILIGMIPLVIAKKPKLEGYIMSTTFERVS